MRILGTAVTSRLLGVLVGVVTLATVLAGCRLTVTGAGSPDSDPAAQGREVPLRWSKTLSSQEFQRVPATLVTREGKPVARDAFLRHFRDSRLRGDLAWAIDAAPRDAVIFAGFLDQNCRPSLTPRLRVDGDTVEMYTDDSGEQGECMVRYTSFAVVAADPALIPPTALISNTAPIPATARSTG
jgi:predicted small secreted protein